MFENRYEGHDHDVCGYAGDLWHELEDVLHFRTNFTVKKEIIDERAALRNTSDNLILNPILLKSGDHHEFGSTMPIGVTWFQLSVQNIQSGNSFFYMSIFTTSLMTTYLVTMIALTISLWFIILIYSNGKLKILQNKKHSVKNSYITSETDRSFMASFLTILGTLTNQGIQLKPSTISLRLIILSSTLFGFVLIQSYSAILLSQLAVSQIPSPINLEDLPVIMPHRSLCVSDRSIAYSHFLVNHSSTEILSKWKPMLNRAPCSMEPNDIVPLEDYCNENTIVFESHYSTNYLRNKPFFNRNDSSDCKFYSFPTRYFNSYISLLTKKDFKYNRLISTYLLKFHTKGIIKRLQEKWLPLHPEQGVKVKRNEAIKFAHIKDLFLLYLLAVTISIIILFIEIIIHTSSNQVIKKASANIIKMRETV